LLHDDPAREFDYTADAERALQQAHSNGWNRDQHQERLGDRVLMRRR